MHVACSRSLRTASVRLSSYVRSVKSTYFTVRYGYVKTTCRRLIRIEMLQFLLLSGLYLEKLPCEMKREIGVTLTDGKSVRVDSSTRVHE